MGALLLAVLLTWPVTFPGGHTINVPVPDYGPSDIVTRSQPQVFFNTQKTFAAVQTCWFAGVKYEGCDLFLVNRQGKVQKLPHGQGTPGLRWTPDGNYLIAQGDTWIRLWNVRGKIRGVTPDIELAADQTILNRDIETTELKGRFICAIASFSVGKTVDFSPIPMNDLRVNPYNLPPPRITLVWTATKYHWPTLQRISQTVPSEIKPMTCL